MKVLLIVPLLSLILFCSCQPLNIDDGGVDETPETVYTQDISLEDGAEKRITLYYGEPNSLLVRVPAVKNTGYMKLALTAASYGAEALGGSNIVVKIFDEEPLIGNSKYDAVVSVNDDTDAIEYFFITDSSEKYILLYHEDSDLKSYRDCIFDLSVESFDFDIKDKVASAEYVECTMSPGETVAFTVPYWGESDYRHRLKAMEIDQLYSLVVSLDRTNRVLNSNYRFGTGLYIEFNDLHFTDYHRFRASDSDAYIFRIVSDTGVTGTIDDITVIVTQNCITGDYYQFELKAAAPHSFADDAFEPDQGPISAAPDSINSGHLSSEIHTIDDDNADWIVWQPWGAGDYRFSVELNDGWYIDGYSEDLSYTLRLKLIDVNGSALLKGDYFWFREAPVTPVLSSDALDFTLDVDTGEPLYLHVESNQELSYRLIAEKL